MKIYLENGTEAVEAEYHESPLNEFNNNPFIQALPYPKSKAEIIQALTHFPDFDQEERKLNSTYRQFMIQRLNHFFQPMPIHIEIWNMLNRLIMEGYVSRNPFDKDYVAYLTESGNSIINQSKPVYDNSKYQSTANSGTLIGFSGMGKTTSVYQVLKHLPQVIVHNEYQGVHFSQIQLVWLKLDAPSNSSLKALCLQFFTKIDEILGTDNYKTYVSRNSSVDSLMPVMAQLAHNVGLGVLVIDEIQNVRNRGATQILNFFVNLINSGINVVLVGTPGAYRLFEGELRIARRLTANHEIIYNNMEYGDEFRFLLESMWSFQWTKEFTPLEDDISVMFYKQTQGISDLMVKLFIYVQQYAIETGKEFITPELIKKVAQKRFKSLKPMLDAIESGNPHKIAKYEDIMHQEQVKDDLRSSKPSNRQIDSVKKKTSSTNEESNDKPHENSKVLATQRHQNEVSVDNDIRRLLKSEPNQDPYDVLKQHGLIDDMTYWVKAGESL
ncbi:AAA family ATPase [Alkalibacillus salilacus]|uniref:ORC1/DEAH AAA+ ATPase domain-containing protein n=1 Tax=Alkalibacillus salilacus TaxID=284582 RepID=A0ABT9VIF6_9BACI|nr:AAA family ATPase [Alkalibacillus salilacus]MDQ0160732.1 hypothetical protein [Alkalibacillus salilacus]